MSQILCAICIKQKTIIVKHVLFLSFLLVGFSAPLAASFELVIDLNTFNESELSFAADKFRVDGSWSITVNSPDTNGSTWASALANIGPNAYSEDNPGSVRECSLVRKLKGSLLASFQYHETGGDPHTMLTWDEIGQASAACGNCGVRAVTSATVRRRNGVQPK